MVAISGNTFPVKDALKALGARWDAANRVWMISADKAEQAKSLVENKGMIVRNGVMYAPSKPASRSRSSYISHEEEGEFGAW
jgi:hypothetical protein